MRSPVFRFFVTTLVSFTFIVNVMAQSKGFDTSRMDRSADACDDFFQYANGTWLKNTEIPASQSRWGSFNILADNNREVLRTVLEEAAAKKNAAKGSDEQLIGDYYSSCMNEAAIEQAGTKPLEPTFKEIDKMTSAADVQAQIARLHSLGVGVVFGFGSGQDLKNSSQVIANAGQGGLSLPNSDYYTKNDPKSVETRQKFVEYAATMFKLLGEPEAKAAESAKTVMEVQMRLANASLPPVEMRNPENRYNKISLAEAQKVTPDLGWASYLAARGVAPLTEINLGQPAFFREVNTMIREMPIDKWKTYFRFMVVNSSASRLPKRFVDANFDFFGKYLSGTKEQEPRWKRCVSATDGALGEALGMEFVKRAFKPEAKKRMDELISNLFVAMKERIDALPWMSSETKTKAQGKLATIKRKIGYPDVLRGYKGLDIDRGSYLLNARRSGQFQIKRNLDDIGKPVDRTRWGMTPPTVNAYYSGTFNEIVFPAGILQPPFFNAAADDAINYGAIGGVIGHEISHGFDDQGSKFDAEGNLKSWWTESDRQKFEERAACVVEQFNGYEVQPGLRINGRLTLGENIGDLGGLNIAYTAFRHSLEGKARPADIDGFTPEQRFFLGWAQVWATKSTAEFERQQVLSDPHSAARYRVNGPISNMPEFAKAFGCKAPAKMIRNDACIIW
ncbi:MAG: M13 family metallopeptidase [Acidobacteria bacterium]|nr:M13 family metallopeptidase [Acidobacteriota bacterium]MCW5948179.1 M13 family metallopeptidase [Pyrinomonadaceae bacterium]